MAGEDEVGLRSRSEEAAGPRKVALRRGRRVPRQLGVLAGGVRGRSQRLRTLATQWTAAAWPRVRELSRGTRPRGIRGAHPLRLGPATPHRGGMKGTAWTD